MAEKDSLFLVEVLVEKLKFYKSPCFSDNSFVTSVLIEEPHMEPIEICEEGTGGSPFSRTFNSGKSCLFFMKAGDITDAMKKFVLTVSLFKSLPCGCLPAKIALGIASVDMTKEFASARTKNLNDANSVGYSALHDTFKLMGADNSETGEISMFVRISCFGGLIMTKFQGGSGGGLNLGGGSVADRSCNPSNYFQSPDKPCACGNLHSRGGGGGGAGGVGGSTCKGGLSGACPSAQDPYSVMPCEMSDDACFCTGPHPVIKSPLACRDTGDYCLHIPKGRSKDYEEIGTNISGNELRIKVPVCDAIIKKMSQTHCSIQKPYDKDNKTAKGKPTGKCQAPCAKNQISLAMPAEQTCCRGPQMAETQFACTTEGCTTVSKHVHQSGVPAKADPKQHDQPFPNIDVFVLKVAKTAIVGDRKCKFEVEVAAPKAGNKRLPIKKINTKMQSNDCQCCSS